MPTLPRWRLPAILHTRLYIVRVLFAALLVLGLLLRAVLLLRPDSTPLPAGDFLLAFASGSAFDALAALYLTLPLILLLCALPARWAGALFGRALGVLALAAGFFLFAFITASEWVFWDEFGARFNFIAVDYLVYTHEVIGNIRESYPVGRILAALALGALLATLPFVRRAAASLQAPVTGRARLGAAALALLATVASGFLVSAQSRPELGSDLAGELAGNGVYQFFAALRNSELDYPRFFATLPDDEAARIIEAGLVSAGEHWPAAPYSEMERLVIGTAPEQRLNIVLVSIESMGSEFIGALGNTKGLTPQIDRLAQDSLFFTNVYATGNRTVRGLEALSLSIPPTPGESIVKRPGAEGLFTMGAVLEDKGYDALFLYGGYGYFDNMAGFFSANDYRVVDRRQIPDANIHYQNIWGVADEDLFDQTLVELDAAHARGKPFFAHVMTTTNHRPYTYPDGRIDIPSGSGRDGAVKYTDYAVGRFVEMARKHPWFRDTLFVITADHGAGARGTMEIPVELYRIPLLVYAPGHIKPARVDRLMSQIDIGPTVLGRLNMSYRSKFMGRDILRAPADQDRAFVATYQTLGYIRDGQLVSLAPQRKAWLRPLQPGGREVDAVRREALTREAIAWYQTAYRLYQNRQFNDDDANDGHVHMSMVNIGGRQPQRVAPPPRRPRS